MRNDSGCASQVMALRRLLAEPGDIAIEEEQSSNCNCPCSGPVADGQRASLLVENRGPLESTRPRSVVSEDGLALDGDLLAPTASAP